MIDVGSVIKLDKDKAVVRIRRKTLCDSCEHKCGMAGDAKFNDVILKNTIGANVGDNVEIKFDDYVATKFASAVYLIPLVLATIGLIIALKFNLSELLQFGIAVLALIVSGVITFFIDKRYKKSAHAPELVKIVE